MPVLRSKLRSGNDRVRNQGRFCNIVGGVKAAYRGLSWAYLLGEGVEKDEAKSLEWARKAADAGDTEMMLRVSNGYEEGRVLKRSLAASMYYLEKAARAGNPEAMRRYSGHLNKFDLFTSVQVSHF